MRVKWLLIVVLTALTAAQLIEIVSAQPGVVYWDCARMLESCELLNGMTGLKGDKGSRGSPGFSGQIGLPGDRGEPGDSEDPKIIGPSSIALKGIKGDRGYPGPQGEKGLKGLHGKIGFPGVVGLPGVQGDPGPIGIRGSPGRLGLPGDSGIPTTNWKQCTFVLDLNKQTGVLKECSFRKNENSSSLHVSYHGDTQIGLCGTCCKQWHFQFNGKGCSSPGPIEAAYSGLMLVNNNKPNTLPVFRHGSVSGYCSNIPRGVVSVSLVLTNCARYPEDKIVIGTNVRAMGRVIIQEVPPPQA